MKKWKIPAIFEFFIPLMFVVLTRLLKKWEHGIENCIFVLFVGVVIQCIMGIWGLIGIRKEKRMALIGLWLHASQDRYAHGLESEKIKHMEKTDNYTYDYKGKPFKTRKKLFNPKFKKVSKWKENKRFKKTVEATEDYLKKVKKALNKRKAGTVKKAKNIDKIVTKFYSKQKVGSLSNDV